MSTLNLLLCDICIILLFGSSLITAEDQLNVLSPLNDGAKGNCSCGGFPSSTIDDNELPLLSQTPGLVVNCDAEGENTCKTLCNALATATKAKGPEVLCNRLKNANELKLSAFFKVCDHPWLYANITAEEPLCCDEEKVKLCPSMDKNNATEKIEITNM